MLKFLRIPFGQSGDRVAVPDAVVPGGDVSYTEGYGADYSRPKADPASKNIEREKMNQLFFDWTTAVAELQSKGVPDFITTLLNGGSPYPYAQNALVRWTDGQLYMSLVNANTATPADATKWGLLPGPLQIGNKTDPTLGANLVGYRGRTLRQHLDDVLNVKDYGALGDGTGRTPADDGVDILSQPWNTWDGTPFKTNLPYSPWATGGPFAPPRATPFLNTDTWDFIGISRCLWAAAPNGSATFIPAGNYKINMSGPGKGFLTGLYLMKGQEQTIFGAGPYETILMPKEDAAFFAANNVGVDDAYQILSLYRPGGPPTNIFDLAFLGPNNYTAASANLSLLSCANINGVTFRDLWLSSAWRGIRATDNSGDSHAKSITTEYCFGASVYTSANSDISVDFCNFWASSVEPGQRGVHALGRGVVTNTRFVNFFGESYFANEGIFSNNSVFFTNTTGFGVHMVTRGVINNNKFEGATSAAMLRAEAGCSITGNVFQNTGDHPSINAGTGAAGSAQNISITGNTFNKTSSTVATQNYSVVAEQSGVSFTGAATASLIIANNTFQGRALNQIGAATMSRNTIAGALSPEVGDIQRYSDVIGKQVLTGSFSTASATINLPILGVGDGGLRAQERLNLVMVYSAGPSQACRGFALYTSRFNGNAVLIATLGKDESGGTITFGVSGANPTATITTSGGGTVTYEVNAVPLI